MARYNRHDAQGHRAWEGFITMTGTKHDIGWKIANELATCGVKLIASLPDNWLMDVIDTVKRDERFRHMARADTDSSWSPCASGSSDNDKEVSAWDCRSGKCDTGSCGTAN
jgi:hypothetical protein